MKIKYLIILILLLVLCINYVSIQHFKNFGLSQRNFLEEELDKLISLASPNHLKNKIKTHTELKEFKIKEEEIPETYSLTSDKVLITLFYDRYNEHSNAFYDDTDLIYNKDLIELDKEFTDLNKKHKLEQEQARKDINDIDLGDDDRNEVARKLGEKNLTQLIKTHQGIISKKQVLLEEKSKNILYTRSHRKQTFKPWNMFKFHYHYLHHNKPYLHKDLIHIEEIFCNKGKMDKCHQKYSSLVPENPENEKYNIQNLAPSPTTDFLIPAISNLGPSDSNKAILKERIKAVQPPRNIDLVDKLPKVILSFLKPISKNIDTDVSNSSPAISTNNEQITVEYDGIYNMNAQYKPITYHNILHFIQESLDKHLEIKEDDTGSTLYTTNDKITYHNKKFGHTIPIPIKYLNNTKLVEPPLYIDYHIIKCPDCAMYIKTTKKNS